MTTHLDDPWLESGLAAPADCPLFDATVADLGRPALLAAS